MKIDKTLAVAAALGLAASAHAADPLPAGTLITGQVSGASTLLLGLDHLFADEPGTNTTALAPADLEFITPDVALAVDFFTDGRVQVWNNSGTTTLPGNYTLTFSFTGLSQPLTTFTPVNTAELAGGSFSLQLLSPTTVSLTLTNLSFTKDFGSVTAQLASAVPEPGSLALMGAGLALIALRRARRSA